MDRQEHDAPDRAPADTGSAHDEQSAAPSEFICAGCGRPLAITLHSTMCFAEALVYCPECERDYQQRRGRWAGGNGELRLG
jgi:hypothetical protein